VGRLGGKPEEKEGNEISSLWLFSDSETILDELGRSLSLSVSWVATMLTETKAWGARETLRSRPDTVDPRLNFRADTGTAASMGVLYLVSIIRQG
jgi:hypothetical protein